MGGNLVSVCDLKLLKEGASMCYAKFSVMQACMWAVGTIGGFDSKLHIYSEQMLKWMQCLVLPNADYGA